MDLAPSVRFGFELALLDLYAASRGRSLVDLITPHPRASVAVSALVSGPPATALGEVRRARSAGYAAVKLKVGGRPVDDDIELVRAVNEELGDAAALRLDANRAWSLEEAERFARGTVDLHLEYIEEPLDESLASIEPGALEDHGYARAVVLKPTLLGGISRTLRFAEYASRLGMRTVISSTYETGVGTVAIVALAARVGGGVPAGIDTYRRLAGDVLRPRLDLPAPRVDVRAMARTRREFDRPLPAYPPG
jgi:O-succinylbenzoate synthase